MAVTAGAALFPARFSPVRRRTSAGRSTPFNPISPSTRNVPHRLAVSTDEAPAANIVAREGGERSERNWLAEAEEAEESERKRRGWREYCKLAEEMMMMRSDGGPPRWFSPLECAPAPATSPEERRSSAPLLLYLPGTDGIGVGLVLHHEKLAKMFDVWCLHIPLMDRTPFTELVKLVERTVRSENNRSPNRPIYLVGESVGACLALAIAARNPNIDLMLILTNPATSFNQLMLQPLLPLLEVMPDQAHLGLPYVLSVMTGDSLGKAVATLSKGLLLQQTVGELSQDLAAISSYLSVLAGTIPKETLLWKLKMLKEASAFANSRLHAINAQTLILSSGNDQFLPSQVECERLRRVLPKCAIRHFNDSGHFLFLDGGVDLVTVIKGSSFYRRSKNLDYVSDFVPPTPSEFKKIQESNRLIYMATSPAMFSTLESGKVVKGLAGIPSEGPVLYVGYHSLLGLELVPLVSQILIQRNVLVRGIAHPMMFTKVKDDGLLPDVSSFDTFRTMGAVPVSATNFFKLFSSKSHVLLYPGGMREALHRKGEEYKLFWPEQSEFVRMAARFGAKIVPFGVVGEDDFGEVVFDYDDLMKIPFFKDQIEGLTSEAQKLRTDANGEVANQDIHLPGILPKLPGGRFYYYFGKPIETEGRKKELKDREKSQELYLQVKSEVEKCLAYLKEKRESDPYRSLVPRLLYQVAHGFESEVPTFEP